MTHRAVNKTTRQSNCPYGNEKKLTVELWGSSVVQARSFRIFVMEKLCWWGEVGQDWVVIGW